MSQITPIPLFQDIEVALLTGGQDRHYAFGLATALVAANVSVDVIGSNLVDSPEMHNTAGLRFFNLLANRKQASILRKAVQILTSYARVIQYAATGRPKILHILWNYKLPYFDRTLLMLYYKLLGKRIVFTAHNINAGRRDSMDSLLNRWTLNCQYRLANHIFVHTRRMKNELLEQYHVKETAVTLIPYGINNAVPHTGLTSIQAKDKLRIQDNEKAILFFGAIKPYKGLEYLVEAFQHLSAKRGELRLIIAGERKKESEEYLSAIQQTIRSDPSRMHVSQEIGFIPDKDIELYFKAADVVVLPYTEIFQSGIAFLAYSFGLPVIATDVGSFREDIVEETTGFVCRPKDPDDLAATIDRYFDSPLYQHLDQRRQEIRRYAVAGHSWDAVAEITRKVYSDLLVTPV